MPPLSRVFQVAHVKPENATNRLLSPGRWIFSLLRKLGSHMEIEKKSEEKNG